MVREVAQLREELLYVSYSVFKDLITNYDDWEIYRYDHTSSSELWTGTPTQIYRTIIDDNDLIDFESLDKDVNMVESEDDAIAFINGTAPPEMVVRSLLETVRGSTFDFYVIPDHRRLRIQSLTGGSEDEAKITLWLDAEGNGNDNDWELLRVGFVDTSNFDYNLDIFFDGDGTKQIVLEAENIGGGGREVAAFWDGFLE